jgi:hypothetical protein
MRIYQTIASLGKYAPLFRARSQLEAIGMARKFEETMQSQGFTCKLGISGVFQNHANPVQWSKDYADIGDIALKPREAKGKPSDKVNSFYRQQKPGECDMVNYEFAELFAAQFGDK